MRILTVSLAKPDAPPVRPEGCRSRRAPPRQGKTHPRYYEYDRQFCHDRQYYFRTPAGEVKQSHSAEHRCHEEKVACRKDTELGPSGRKCEAHEEKEGHKANDAEHEGLVLRRTHSTLYMAWA